MDTDEEPTAAAAGGRAEQTVGQLADGIERVAAAVRALATRLRPISRALAGWTLLTGALATALWWSEAGSTAAAVVGAVAALGTGAWLAVPWSARRAAAVVEELAGAVRRAPSQVAPLLADVRTGPGALRFSGRALRGALQLRRLRSLRRLAELARVQDVAALSSAPARTALAVFGGAGSLAALSLAVVAGAASALV